MADRLKMLMGVFVGATAMYYFDPSRGRYRRALVADQLVHAGRESRRAARVVRRDFYNRARGTAATLRSTLMPASVDDAVLEARTRACLGRVVSHPASIHVEAREGVVTLSGPILEDEIPLVMHCVERVNGVKDVHDELEAHEEPGNVPGLQGGSRRRGVRRAPFDQANWSPTERLAGAAGGVLTLACGIRQRGVAGAVLSAAGLLLVGRAASNRALRRLLGIGAERRAVDVHKSIRIRAPLEEVFALWDDFENFPSFMSHVVRVRRLGSGEENRWRWTVQGPGVTRAEFDASVIAREENRLIAWQTDPSSAVQHGGVARFIGNGDGTTTVEVRMTYNPIGGALGHAVARLLGADPKHQMDDDLLRMKTYLETGRAPRDAAAQMPADAAGPPHHAEEPPPRTH